MNHFLTTSQLTTEDIYAILKKAEQFATQKDTKLPGQHFVANLFFEPSTRTKTSFEVAERKLGLEVIPFDVTTSSLSKGETLYDTVKTLEAIGLDLLVIRHEADEYFNELKDTVSVPIINAGDGCGNHPTQSLLDLYTIYQEFGHFDGIKVAIIGDIRHSRVAHSNAEALARLGAEVVFSGPKEWFDERLFSKDQYEPIDEAMQTADVVMMLRIQHERHDIPDNLTSVAYHQAFGLTIERERKMKPNSIIMHPAPVNRDVEIASELVECERSRIFTQMKNGMFIRMAVIDAVLTKNKGGKTNDFKNSQWPIAY